MLKLDAEENSTGDPIDDHFLAGKISQFFQRYDFSILERTLDENTFLQKFYDTQEVCHIQWFGLALKVNHNLKYTINSNLKDASADVFCFDADTSGILYVGHYNKKELLVDSSFKESFAGRLLFTFDPAESMTKIYDELKNSHGKIDLNTINWPEFWPKNTRGETK